MCGLTIFQIVLVVSQCVCACRACFRTQTRPGLKTHIASDAIVTKKNPVKFVFGTPEYVCGEGEGCGGMTKKNECLGTNDKAMLTKTVASVRELDSWTKSIAQPHAGETFPRNRAWGDGLRDVGRDTWFEVRRCQQFHCFPNRLPLHVQPTEVMWGQQHRCTRCDLVASKQQ